MTTSTTTVTAGVAPQLFVYRGAGCTGRDAIGSFDTLVGRSPDGVTEFVDISSWQNMLNSVSWAMWCWGNNPHGLSQAVPMLVQGTTLAAGYSGAYDQYFKQLGTMLVANGHADAYLRIGWEMNGSWYPWAAAQDPYKWVQYYKRIVHILRLTPGQHFKIVWNPAIGTQQIAPDKIYPGNSYVDVIALDVYDQSWNPADVDPQTRWNNLVYQSYGLGWLTRYAAARLKPIAIPEWGTGWRSDGHGYPNDPLYVTNMAAYLKANNALYHGYWDYAAPDFDGEISTGRQPDAAAAFAAAFGPVPQ